MTPLLRGAGLRKKLVKDLLKNPTLYYVLVPVAVALWPLLIWTVYLPGAEHKWDYEKGQYSKGQEIIAEILSSDPGRLEFAGPKETAVEFDYAVAVEKIATLCNIPSSNYRLSSGPVTTSADGQKSQNAKINLKDVDIVKFARFLSTIQLHWANLQSTQIKLTKKKNMPDIWDVDLDFKYYF